MTHARHKQIRSYISFLFSDRSKKESDCWWMISKLIPAFKNNRKEKIWTSYLKVFDESMSAYRPQTLKTGNLPHLSSIMRKPEPLGTEFKVCADTLTSIIVHLEIQKGKHAMHQEKYASTKKATTACVLRMAEATTRNHNTDKDQNEIAIPTETYLGDSWFSSVESALEMRLRGHHYIGIVKTSHAGYPKAFLEEQMKN